MPACTIHWYFMKSFKTITLNYRDQGLPYHQLQELRLTFNLLQRSLSQLSQKSTTFPFPALPRFFLNQQSFPSRDLTSMGRLSDVPDKNPAIIWWTGKDVVIYWAHWKAIHCILMGEHIQGLSAGEKTHHSITLPSFAVVLKSKVFTALST